MNIRKFSLFCKRNPKICKNEHWLKCPTCKLNLHYRDTKTRPRKYCSRKCAAKINAAINLSSAWSGNKIGRWKRTALHRQATSANTKLQWMRGEHTNQSARMLKKWAEDDGTFRQAISTGVSRRLNKDWKNKKFRKKILVALRLSGRTISKPHKFVYKIIKKLLPTAILEHPFNTYDDFDKKQYNFGLDIAILDRKIAIEVDGMYWHSKPGMKEKDEKRDFILWDRGWKLYRIGAEVAHKEIWPMLFEIFNEEQDAFARLPFYWKIRLWDYQHKEYVHAKW